MACPDCTQVATSVQALHAEVDRLTRANEALQLDLQNDEVELRSKRREITRLKNELAKKAARQRDKALIGRIGDYWKDVCGHPRAIVEPSGERADAIWARLEGGYTEDRIMRGIYGASKFPFVGPQGRARTGTAKQRFDDLELICRSDKTLENFIKLADLADEEDGKGGAPEPPPPTPGIGSPETKGGGLF